MKTVTNGQTERHRDRQDGWTWRTLSDRGLKLKYIQGPHLEDKRARGPQKENKTVPRAAKEG
jgi:hypothetical protein